MDGEAGAQWELSKENIQPLKQGRKVAKLNTILHQHQDEDTARQIQEERRQFEEELREYSGEDPLDPWYRYIQWVEQSYPKGGKEGQVHVLIEKCIKKFKDEELVQKDERFLEIWLKYSAMATHPLDVFDFMFKQGVCTQQSGLYEAWAYQLERNGSYKKADSIFTNGLRAATEPEVKERLKGKQKQFQARALRRIKGEEIPEAETEEEERSALGQLRGHGRHGKVGSVRVGAAKLGGPGTLGSKQPLKDSNQQKGGGGFKIFQDENGAGAAEAGGAGAGAGQVRLPSSQDRKENEAKAGAWGAVRSGRPGAGVPIAQVTRPAFTVHQDPGVEQPAPAPPAHSNVLHARSGREEAAGTVHCPVALFEPADPGKRTMYCKDKVYQGATEFSFEELQAARWRRRERSRLEAADMDSKRRELEEMERRLREQQEAMARQMAEWQSMMAGQQRAAGPAVYYDENAPPSSDSSSSLLPRSTESSLQRKHSMDDTAALMAANPSGGRSAATPSPHGSRAPVWSQPSPTVNTREAMAEMQQLWCHSEPTPEPAPRSQPAPAFTIFSDENAPPPSAAPAASAPFQIYSDENDVPAAMAAFPIFSDGAGRPEVVPIKPRLPARPAPLPEQAGEEVENDENCPPAGLAPPGRQERALQGALQPALGVQWVPLEVQERVLDEDEAEQEEALRRQEDGGRPRPLIGANQTIALPDEEDFERMAKTSSTPYTGRPFQMDQDENTCAVDIVYKAAMLPPPAPAEQEPAPPAAAACLSPIVETSREYRTSSSSSGCDTLQAKTPGDKSHWGNTGATQHFRHLSGGHSKTTDSTGCSMMSRTPGHFLGGVSHGGSGYMGDRSSMANMTKSGVKDKRELSTPTRPELSYDKRLKLAEASPQMDEEPTGMFGDMMAEFQQNLGRPDTMGRVEQETSLHVSLAAEPVRRERTELEITQGNITGANMTGLMPGLNLTAAPFGLNLTAAASTHLNITAAPPGLDMTGAAPVLDMTGAAPVLDMTGAAPVLDMTGAAPVCDMTGPEEEDLVSQTMNLSLDEDVDPFAPSTHAALLARLPAPLSSLHGYVSLAGPLPAVRTRALLTLGEDTFFVSECKGEGGFAKVFAASKQDTEEGMNSTISGIDAVLKVQKPANDWEWYVCREVGLRVEPGLRAAFMASPRNYHFNNGGIFVSYHQKLGSLLDIVNITKTCGVQKSCIEPMAVYFTIEMLGMVEALHEADILHADLKADNFLLQCIPVPNQAAASAEEMFQGLDPSLQLIDFGKSIDLRLLPKGILFNKVCKTDGLLCPEMREGRGWREHLDYFGLAATAYLLLFSSYMDVVKVSDKWEAKGSFKRWWQTGVWKEFFGEFLNLRGDDKKSFPDLRAWRLRFMQLFFEKDMVKSLERLRLDVGKAMANL